MTRTLRTHLALLCALGTAAPAFADELELRPYLSGGYAYTFADKDRQSDDGHGAFVGGGWAINPHWGVELSGFWSQFGRDLPSDPLKWKEYGVKADAQFFYARKPAFSPYVGLGLGVGYSEIKGGEDSTDPLLDAGVGFISYFGNSPVGVRGDVRYRWFDTDNIGGIGWRGEPIAKLGLVVALGESKPAEKPVKDADGDGVPDDIDLCPGTAKGVAVDAKGCPLDSDGDGVPDGLDECPGTPPGVAVDAKGCPSSLGSGRFKITGSGAELRFEDVHFEFDQSTLTEYGKEMLDDAATVINQTAQKYPALKVDISGHTDETGTPGYNQALSERRAATVKQYLIRKGVEPGRINIYSYGESKPAATNDTVEGRTQNRRAETRTRAE